MIYLVLFLIAIAVLFGMRVAAIIAIIMVVVGVICSA